MTDMLPVNRLDKETWDRIQALSTDQQRAIVLIHEDIKHSLMIAYAIEDSEKYATFSLQLSWVIIPLLLQITHREVTEELIDRYNREIDGIVASIYNNGHQNWVAVSISLSYIIKGWTTG